MKGNLAIVVSNAIAARTDAPILSAPMPEILNAIHYLKYSDEYRVHCSDGVPRMVVLSDGTRIQVTR